MLSAWIMRLRASLTELSMRVVQRIDEHARRDREGWGANLEYRRRYTNPDDAKRHRTPPTEKS